MSASSAATAPEPRPGFVGSVARDLVSASSAAESRTEPARKSENSATSSVGAGAAAICTPASALRVPLPPAPEPDRHERVRAELDVLGLDLSEHVIDGYRPLLDALGVTPAGELLTLRGGAEVTVAGVRVATQTPPMRSGKRVVFISVDDGTGCADATFFEDAQQRSGPVLFGTPLLLIHGQVRRTGARGVSVQADEARDLKDAWREFQQLARP